MSSPLSEHALQQLFTEARTFSHWLDQPVPQALLERLYTLATLPPTAANSNPGRFVFLTSRAAKEKLVQALSPGNVEKTLAAPVTVADSRYKRAVSHNARLSDIAPTGLGPAPRPQSTQRTKHLSTELWPRRRPSDLVAPPIGPHPANETHNDRPTSGR